eukprot:1136264-Pelagomonas_calceolata.AAC.10
MAAGAQAHNCVCVPHWHNKGLNMYTERPADTPPSPCVLKCRLRKKLSTSVLSLTIPSKVQQDHKEAGGYPTFRSPCMMRCSCKKLSASAVSLSTSSEVHAFQFTVWLSTG